MGSQITFPSGSTTAAPTTHAASHGAGQSDAITISVSQISDYVAPVAISPFLLMGG